MLSGDKPHETVLSMHPQNLPFAEVWYKILMYKMMAQQEIRENSHFYIPELRRMMAYV